MDHQAEHSEGCIEPGRLTADAQKRVSDATELQILQHYQPFTPVEGTIIVVQCVCLNTVFGLSIGPLVCGAAGGCDMASTGSAAGAALLLASAAQATGTCALIGMEVWPKLQSQEFTKRARLSSSVQEVVTALGCAPSAGVLVPGLVTAAAAAAAVTACNVALATVLGADVTVQGNTQALRDALHGGASGGAEAGPMEPGGCAFLLLASLVLADCVLAPLTEELVFRGVLLRSLLGPPGSGGRSEPRAALGPLLVQAFVFACYHLNGAEWPAQFVLGLTLGAGYVWAGRNLAASMLAHSVYNGSAVLLLLLRP